MTKGRSRALSILPCGTKTWGDSVTHTLTKEALAMTAAQAECGWDAAVNLPASLPIVRDALNLASDADAEVFGRSR